MNENNKQNNTKNSVFGDSSISRRQFIRISAATTGVVAIPGLAFAETTSPKLTDEYQYAINHTNEREEVPTLITFSEEAGLDELATLRISTRTTTEPTTAAHAYLTTEQVQQVLAIDSVTKLQFSPGANPFWLLDYYPEGVFPHSEESVDFIDFNELSQGMERLAEQYPDQLRFQSIGDSPGYYNFLKQEEDPKDVRVVELTNDINDGERFQNKPKVVFSLSIHADERGGVEAGTRFIEDVLTGEEETVEALLDELALIFVYPNPDGWVARYSQYNDRGEGYERYTAGTTRFSNEPIDPNRNYPTIGWIDATHYPAEPDGLNLENDDPGIDSDVAAGYTDNVIDALNVVEHLRGYDNLSYGFDLHGMYSSEWMIEGATVNEQYSYEELNDIYEYSNTVDKRLEEKLAPLLEENENLFEGLQSEEFFGEDATIPETAFNYGTNQDVLDYGTTGYLSSWMAHPEEEGGLGMKVMLHEIAFNNQPTPTTYTVADDFEVSNLVELWIVGFGTVMRTLIEHAAKNIDTTLKTNDRSTAIVTTESLERSSNQLRYVEKEELDVSDTDEGLLTGHVVDTDGERTVATPDPQEILNYEQRAYETSPFVFFDMLANEVADEDGNRTPNEENGFVEITVDEVSNTGLLTEDEQPKYENIIVIHDSKISNQSYIDAIDEYVEAGGNLVLTDTGVTLLASLDNELAAEITEDDITIANTAFALLEDDNYPHHLLTDTRPYQDQLWRNAPLGYGVPRRGSENEVPMPLVDSDAFTAVGGTVAATTNEKVALGSILSDPDTKTGITIVSTLLPPARQVHLHPFGMADYTISFFGLLILTNALGYSHCWYVDNELVRRIGALEMENGGDGTA